MPLARLLQLPTGTRRSDPTLDDVIAACPETPAFWQAGELMLFVSQQPLLDGNSLQVQEGVSLINVHYEDRIGYYVTYTKIRQRGIFVPVLSSDYSNTVPIVIGGLDTRRPRAFFGSREQTLVALEECWRTGGMASSLSWIDEEKVKWKRRGNEGI